MDFNGLDAWPKERKGPWPSTSPPLALTVLLDYMGCDDYDDDVDDYIIYVSEYKDHFSLIITTTHNSDNNGNII